MMGWMMMDELDDGWMMMMRDIGRSSVVGRTHMDFLTPLHNSPFGANIWVGSPQVLLHAMLRVPAPRQGPDHPVRGKHIHS